MITKTCPNHAVSLIFLFFWDFILISKFYVQKLECLAFLLKCFLEVVQRIEVCTFLFIVLAMKGCWVSRSSGSMDPLIWMASIKIKVSSSVASKPIPSIGSCVACPSSSTVTWHSVACGGVHVASCCCCCCQRCRKVLSKVTICKPISFL